MFPPRNHGIFCGLLMACYFATPDDAAGGGVPAVNDGDGPSLVRDETPAETPAAASPEVPAAVAPAPPAPVSEPPTQTSPVAPAPSGMDKAVQSLQQDFGVMRNAIGEIKDALAGLTKSREAIAANPGGAPTAQQVQALAAQADELERMLADDYEVDVANTPKQLARALVETRKTLAAEVKALREENATIRRETAGERTAREAAAGQQAFNDLQAQVRAKEPAADLHQVYRDSAAKATAEGFGAYGAAALNHRATQLFQEQVDRMLAAAPAAPSPSPVPAVKVTPAGKAAPVVPPITPGGAQARIANTGGNPLPAPSSVPSEDEIYERHTLVK